GPCKSGDHGISCMRHSHKSCCSCPRAWQRLGCVVAYAIPCAAGNLGVCELETIDGDWSPHAHFHLQPLAPEAFVRCTGALVRASGDRTLRFESDGEPLKRAIRATFERRKAPFPTGLAVALTPAFTSDTAKKTQRTIWHLLAAETPIGRGAIQLWK